MSQRVALLAAAGITAFVLVVIGGLVARAALASPTVSVPVAPTDQVLITESPSTSPDKYPVTAMLAATIASNIAPGTRVIKEPELVDFQGVVAYEVTTDHGLIYVDANSGQVLHNGVQPPARVWAGEHEEHEEHEGLDHDD